MATQKTGDGSAYPVSTLVPDDGDDQPVASTNVALEALLDRTEWLREQFTDKPIRVELPEGRQIAAGNYDWSATNQRYGWLQATAAPDQIHWYVTIPANHKVTAIRAHLIGDDGPGTHVGIPAELPKVFIWRQPLTGGTYTPLVEEQDSSGSLVVYEAYHTIEASGLSLLFDDDYCVVGWLGEDGAQAAANTVKLIGIELDLEYVPS